MYIKQVIIEGFKSYKEQVAIEPFSPKHNCIVGANGSGKTNFFNAIRFVLSDFTTQLRAEDRQQLLHDGAGQSVLSAYVEIVFDNSDNRLPIDKEVVRLRRSIGLKKDEYFLDRKHITKPEVMNLLESAGFSRSNPYYVVQQGKIQALTVMRDTERLELLKEIGGTKVYDERRRESLKILQETAARQAQIEETIQYIDERLAELNEEREELVKYQEIDRKRRSLEYTIFERELSDTRAKLDEVDAARQRANEKANRVHEEARNAHAEAQERGAELKAAERTLQTFAKDRKALEAEKAEGTQRRAQLELDASDLEERLAADRDALAERRRALEDVEAEVARTQAEVARLRPAFEQKLAEEERVNGEIEAKEQRLAALYSKQGRSARFKSQAEKDAAVKADIKDKTAQLQKKRDTIAKHNTEIEALRQKQEADGARSAELEARLAESKAQLASLSTEVADLVAERNRLQNERNTHWRKEEEVQEDLSKKQADLKKREKTLEGTLPRDLQLGLVNIKRICADHKIQGMHGPLIELFDCPDKFDTAVEVTAGLALFHVVVDDDAVASRLIHYLNEQKAGRVSFLPLNKLAQGRDPPPPPTSDAIPLLSRLSYHEKFQPAMKSIFGKVLLCKGLEVAQQASRTTNLDCITMEGDQVNKKGAMTGGFHDPKRSRLRAMREVKSLTGGLGTARDGLAAARARLAELDAEVNRALSAHEKAAKRHQAAVAETEAMRAEQAELAHNAATWAQQLESKQRLVKAATEAATRLELQLKEAEAELAADVMAALTPAEAAELHGLHPALQALRKAQAAASQARIEAETAKGELEVHLDTNLVKRKAELLAAVEAADLGEKQRQLEAHRVELAAVETTLGEVARRFQEKKAATTEAKAAVVGLKARLEELRALQDNEEQLLQEEAKEMEQLMGRRTLLLTKREELQRQIRELGSLPSNAFDKYKGKALKELHRALHQCHEALKKFAHVNKKALDQFLQFTEQREDLSRRQEEVQTSKTKIAELIEGLDRKKDEDIERTFRGVAMHFKEIFQEIVQTGKGELIMIKNKEAEEGGSAAAAATVGDAALVAGKSLETSVEKYSAVQCRVSFGGGEAKTMKQLSGGQKAVVALSLIFSIQRVDPAPFYLFDEIDAALDAQYRAAVGNMIKKQAAQNTQFVTTTFRPELVKVCSKVYGVTHKNRVSCVDVITKDDALGFIEDFN